MADARASILAGSKAAATLHRDLHVKERLDNWGTGRVDVFETISKLGATLMFQPLDKLLGAYLPAEEPGVLITTRRPLPVQRFTAAHELGHLFMKHEPSLDDDRILRRAPFMTAGDANLQEREADAFAAMFLAPDWLVAKVMERQGWVPQSFRDPKTVYQASLRLGTSYQATCHVLERFKVIDAQTRERHLKIKPKEIKSELVGDYKPDNWWFDVWVLTERDEGTLIEGSRRDLFALQLKEHTDAGYLWSVDELNSSGFAILSDDWESHHPKKVGSDTTRRIVVRSEKLVDGKLALEERRRWINENQGLNRISFDYSLRGPEEPGMWGARLALEVI